MKNDSVLVVIGYTDFKWYCRPLLPKNYEMLTYQNKELNFIDENNYSDLGKNRTGDEICAEFRRVGINNAIAGGFDWVYFMDLDTIPAPDMLELLLVQESPFIGGAIACRGDSTKLIAHEYGSWELKDRRPPSIPNAYGTIPVAGISGASMLVHKSIFTKVGYDGYRGVEMYPGRTTCDDEFYCIKVHDKTGITPELNLNARAWHLHSDGFAYCWFGMRQPFKRIGDKISFRGDIYE